MTETYIEENPRSGRAASSMVRAVLLFAGGFFVLGTGFYFSVLSGAEYRTGVTHDESVVSLGKDSGIFPLASDLETRGVIGNRAAFLFVLWKDGSWKKLQAGEYLVSGEMTIGDIISKMVRGETVQKGVKVTFPEGWTAEEMAGRLLEKGLPGDEFLKLVRAPRGEWRTDYPFLRNLPEKSTLEGVLFPDTYFFSTTFGAEAIVRKMLEGFQSKAAPELSSKSGTSWFEMLTLSSIVEAEVATEDDRKVVADIFIRRLDAEMPLQSDATVRYVLGEKKVKYSLDDIAADSPYNTYRNKGLPPGPIGNPGLSSIRATLSPQPNPYWYFLNNAETGVSVFSKTFEEHVANKARNGL